MKSVTELLEKVRNEAAALRSKMENSLNSVQQNLEHDIVQKTQEEVFAIARKTLKDLASVSLEEQSVNVFISRLKGLKTDDKKKLIEAFKIQIRCVKQKSILIQTAYNLPQKQQDRNKKCCK